MSEEMTDDIKDTIILAYDTGRKEEWKNKKEMLLSDKTLEKLHRYFDMDYSPFTLWKIINMAIEEVEKK